MKKQVVNNKINIYTRLYFYEVNSFLQIKVYDGIFVDIHTNLLVD